MTTRPAPARTIALRLAAATAAVAGSLVLSGCSMLSPVQTNSNVQTADGVPVDLGSIQIRDLLIIATDKGGPGVLVGQVVNQGTAATKVDFASAGATSTSDVVSTDVPAYDSVTLSTSSTQLTLPSVSTAPGGLMSLQVHTADHGVNTVQVPVLAPDGVYAGESPTASPSPSASPG